MRIAIVSDAWRPQINGVVRTIETVAQLLRADGHDVEVFGPDRFRTLPCPTYPEIRLSLFPAARLSHMLKLFAPDAIHLVTEGPLGWAARRFCLRRNIPFTTAYHTRFPEYVRARIRVPLAWSYAFVRRFHAPSAAVLVVAQSIRDELAARGFRNLMPWSRGVDIAAFRPRPRSELNDARPVWLYAGRVAIEKNIKAFLELDLPGSKWVVGGGPQLKELRRRQGRALSSARSTPMSWGSATPRPTASSSQPHRHVRPGDGRGAGLRRAGRRLSGARSARRRDRAGRGRDRRGPRTACLAAVKGDPATAGATPRPSPGKLRRAVPRHPAPHPAQRGQPLKRRVLPDAAAS